MLERPERYCFFETNPNLNTKFKHYKTNQAFIYIYIYIYHEIDEFNENIIDLSIVYREHWHG